MDVHWPHPMLMVTKCQVRPFETTYSIHKHGLRARTLKPVTETRSCSLWPPCYSLPFKRPGLKPPLGVGGGLLYEPVCYIRVPDHIRHRHHRLVWVRKHFHWTRNLVLFSVESRFTLSRKHCFLLGILHCCHQTSLCRWWCTVGRCV